MKIDNIQTGDILLSHTPYSFSLIPNEIIGSFIVHKIEKLTKSPFSHCGVIEKFGNELYICEAVSQGLRENKFIPNYLSQNKLKKIIILRFYKPGGVEFNDSDKRIIKNICHREMNKQTKYDKKLLILLGLALTLFKFKTYQECLSYFKSKRDSWWICSEYSQMILRNFNIKVTENNCLSVPNDFLLVDNYKIVYTNIIGDLKFAKKYPMTYCLINQKLKII